jgi:hypothetical protein
MDWDKVEKCQHEFNPDYCVSVHCDNQELGCAGGMESHCKKCGVYITEDPCGQEAGMSGWSHKRWKKFNGGIWSGAIRRGNRTETNTG